MSDAIVSSLITGSLALLGVILSNLLAAKKTEAALRISQAVTDTKIGELTREVREHNHFARRMPVVEQQLKALEKRVADLENYHKEPR